MTIQYQGVWTLSAAAQLQSTQRWVTDPLYKNTTLLLQADDATNGLQNNTFLDSSPNAFAITRNGNTTQGSFTPFSLQPGAWGNFFNGSSDYLSFSDNAAFELGSGDFTLEAWVNFSALPASNGHQATIFSKWGGGTSQSYEFYLYNNAGTQQIYFTYSLNSTSSTNVGVNWTPTVGVWYHVACVRSGSNLFFFVNGTQQGSTGSISGTIADNASTLQIGTFNNTANTFLNGYLSNARMTKGGALYTGTFTPSTTFLTTTVSSGTVSLLTCQSNRFIDNSANVFSVVVNGSPSVQAFSPFAPQFQRTPSVIGGSAYFDGTTDWLSVADNAAFTLGNGNFTIELWVYSTLAGTRQFLAGQINSSGVNSSASFTIEKTAGNKLSSLLYSGSTAYTATSSADIRLNAWTHIALVRDGNTLRQYINGVQDGTVGVTGVTANDSSTQLAIGRAGEFTTVLYFGYLSDYRFVSGTCLYPSGTLFTPPTAPLTAIANTQLLTNFTNAGIYDGTMKNNLETVGNAQVSTAVVKYGSGSMYFDGTTDALSMPNSPVLQLGSADFTCEFWAYRLAATNMTWVFLNGNSSNFAALRLDTDTSGNIFLLMSTSGSAWAINTSGSAVLPLSTWTHIAAVRFGGTMRLYVNGVALISTTISGSLTAGTSQQVGANFGATQVVNGYVDDLRLTNGIARYTANFIPPSVALPRQ